jgi:carbonic anhydrase-like protein
MAPAYQLRTKLSAKPATTLVVCCSDHRFQTGIQEFLSQGLRIENYDLLAIPGGPQCLTLVEYLPKFSWVGWRWTRFLLEDHELKRLILVGHQDCSWYNDLPLHLHESPEPRKRQEQDLRRAKLAITKELPHMNVETYFATYDALGSMSVEDTAQSNADIGR